MFKAMARKLAKVSKMRAFSAIILIMMMSILTVNVYAAEALVTGMLTDVLVPVLVAIGGGLTFLGIVNLADGYGNDDPAAKSKGMKLAMGGVGVAIVGLLGVPLLVTFVGTTFGGGGP